MRFSDVIGNEDALRTLREMVDSGRLPHALLIHGAPGIGKMRAARALAAYINCENRLNGDSCGQCPSCRRIASGNDPDLHYIYPIYKVKSQGKIVSTDYIEEWRKFLEISPYMEFPKWMELMNAGNSQPQISVEESDAICSSAALTSYSSKYKIYLIWLPEKMGLAAANKLLKVLEEPFEDTLFICVSNDPGAILPTIFSRLQRVEMRNSTALQARLAGEDANEEREEFGTCFRDVMRAAYGRRVATLQTIANNMAGLGREKCRRMLSYFADMTRENYISNLCIPPLNVMTRDEEAFSQKFAPFINERNVEQILRQLDAADRDIARNGNGKLILFDLFLHLMIELRR